MNQPNTLSEIILQEHIPTSLFTIVQKLKNRMPNDPLLKAPLTEYTISWTTSLISEFKLETYQTLKRYRPISEDQNNHIHLDEYYFGKDSEISLLILNLFSIFSAYWLFNKKNHLIESLFHLCIAVHASIFTQRNASFNIFEWKQPQLASQQKAQFWQQIIQNIVTNIYADVEWWSSSMNKKLQEEIQKKIELTIEKIKNRIDQWDQGIGKITENNVYTPFTDILEQTENEDTKRIINNILDIFPEYNLKDFSMATLLMLEQNYLKQLYQYANTIYLQYITSLICYDTTSKVHSFINWILTNSFPFPQQYKIIDMINDNQKKVLSLLRIELSEPHKTNMSIKNVWIKLLLLLNHQNNTTPIPPIQDYDYYMLYWKEQRKFTFIPENTINPNPNILQQIIMILNQYTPNPTIILDKKNNESIFSTILLTLFSLILEKTKTSAFPNINTLTRQTEQHQKNHPDTIFLNALQDYISSTTNPQDLFHALFTWINCYPSLFRSAQIHAPDTDAYAQQLLSFLFTQKPQLDSLHPEAFDTVLTSLFSFLRIKNSRIAEDYARHEATIRFLSDVLTNPELTNIRDDVFTTIIKRLLPTNEYTLEAQQRDSYMNSFITDNYQTLIETWHPQYMSMIQQVVEKIIETTPSEIIKILDIWCGPGNILDYMRTQFSGANKQYSITGIDASDHMIQLGKQRFSEDLSINTAHEDVFDLDEEIYGNQQIITCSLMAHNIPKDKKITFYQKIYNLLAEWWTLYLTDVFFSKNRADGLKKCIQSFIDNRAMLEELDTTWKIWLNEILELVFQKELWIDMFPWWFTTIAENLQAMEAAWFDLDKISILAQSDTNLTTLVLEK